MLASFEDQCIPGCALPLRGTKPWKNKTLDPENRNVKSCIHFVYLYCYFNGFQEGGEVKWNEIKWSENKMN